MSQADLSEALEHYRSLAPRYDHRTRFINGIRLRTIAALQLRPGDVALDAGCGTGWCLPHLAQPVAPGGRLLAFDPSGEMLDMARSRPLPAGVALDVIESTAETVVLPVAPDAILFSYTHDLINAPAALANVLRQAKPGARVAATSTKLYAPWLAPANWYLRATHRGYITNFTGFEAPWSLLASHLDDFRVQTGPFTQHYIATGRVRPAVQEA